jgi:shikimate kinase
VPRTPTLSFLVGLPGAGKSTFRAKLEAANRNLKVVSTDDMIEIYADAKGLTYSQVFAEVDMASFERRALELTADYTSLGYDVLIDRVNLRRVSRQRFITETPLGTHKVAYVFHVPPDEHWRRLKERGQRTGKVIPWAVVEHMRSVYDPPVHSDFDEIHIVDHVTGTATPFERTV